MHPDAKLGPGHSKAAYLKKLVAEKIITQKDAALGANTPEVAQSGTASAAQVSGTVSIPSGATAPAVGTVLSPDDFVAALPGNYQTDLGRSTALTSDLDYFRTHRIPGTTRNLQVEVVADGTATDFNSSTGRIQIEQRYFQSADSLTQALAHEMGHAYRVYTRNINMDDHAAYRQALGREEASAQWHSMLVMDQIYGIDNVRPGLFGASGATYVGLYKASSGVVSTTALDQMATHIESETPSGHPGSTYLDVWRSDFNAAATRRNADVDRSNADYTRRYNAWLRDAQEMNSHAPPDWPIVRIDPPLPDVPRREFWP
jgi:hypothetical protein